MTRMTTTPLALSADYADALLAARRAKNWVFLFLLIGLLAQITIFCLAKFTDVIRTRPGAEPTVKVPDVDVERSPAATTTTAPTPIEGDRDVTEDRTSVQYRTKVVGGGVLAWLTNAIVYLGTILSIAMSAIILLIVLVMLVGRLVGVSHTTSAYVWAVILALLLFPWQLFYGPETAAPDYATPTAHTIDINDFRIPGALYTWGELEQGVNFSDGFDKVAVLRYARFLGFPLVALIILFMVQAKSGRGVKYALGEAEVHVDVATSET